ncbi:RNI-like protein [Ascodesmis nigricans]|uniref:RNI-like protein n=1 Tax=Ascodesmis nigricans TaxID=341454 RepID=A0A4S2MLI3_9PEZI|nr:RNI-like protein [Ascodesmis nigricans]
MSRRGVHGPNSALTEFLREKGINANQIRARFLAREQAENANTNTGSSSADSSATATPATSTTPTAPTPPAATTRRTRSARASAATTPAKGKGKARVLKKRKREDSDDDDDDDDDGDFNVFDYASKAPEVGQQAFCAECDSRFKVTAYSKASEDGDGLLCPPCGRKSAKEEKELVRRAGAEKRTRRVQARKALDAESAGPRSLKDLCIKFVADHIRDVEEFGDLESGVMQRICEILARNRSLDSATLKLFTVPQSEKLTLHDCARIETNELKSIAAFMPQLRHLGLYHAGSATDDVLSYYAEKLPHLESFHLHGAFLVTPTAYSTFFTQIGHQLTSLTLSNTRNTPTLIHTITTTCPNLTALNLSHLTRLDNTCISHLSSLQFLTSLDISHSASEITDAAITPLLESIGSGLTHLDLSGLPSLTGLTTSAIHACCAHLRSLNLSDLPLLSASDITSLFTNWTKNRGLVKLQMKHLSLVDDDALKAVVAHSGRSLEVLNVNSCAELTKEGVMEGLARCERLGKLDVGFVRAVDDEVVEMALGRGVSWVSVWGCAKVTACCGIGRGVTVVGREVEGL